MHSFRSATHALIPTLTELPSISKQVQQCTCRERLRNPTAMTTMLSGTQRAGKDSESQTILWALQAGLGITQNVI